jgi:hypothetical protein
MLAFDLVRPRTAALSRTTCHLMEYEAIRVDYGMNKDPRFRKESTKYKKI